MSPHPSGSLMGLGVIDPALEARLAMGMARVEDFLRASVRSEYPFVTEASRHLVDAGGKRFRPLLVLLAAEFGDPEAPGVVPAAVVVELTHLATLYHDDVMDEADLRRGAASANARWDNTVAILTGEASYHATYDHCTAKYLEQAGVPNEHIRLETRGIRGNGHGIPTEKNNLVTARLVDAWLQGKVR